VTGLAKVWPYRVLAWTLVQKELKTRYRGSVLGFLWTLLNPLFMMLVYTLVFSVYMRVPTKNYALFVFSGLLPWVWISSCLMQSTVAVLRDGHLLKKVSFPAQIMPLVTVAATSINFLLSLPLYFAFALFFRLPLGWPLLLLPVLFLTTFLMLYGLGLLLSALNVRYRDVEHLTGNLLTLLFFLTPILYAEDWVPEKYRFLTVGNPLAAVVGCFRDVLFNNRPPGAWPLVYAPAAALLLVLAGEAVFRAMSPGFAEEV
jgi:lipopolysaccharide transport system permease protein